ncbi:MAG TPA: DUF4097 family beta strand repeat-containing protein [Terriglobales bacterium]|nr:DUF4097 family beta strand repeat-containing protein [Terriglobales bacterium]
MRYRVSFLLIALIGLSSLALADEWKKEFTTSAKPSIHVDANDATIEVQAVDGNKIEARVVTSRGKISPDEVRVTDRQSGDRIDLEVRQSSHHFCIGICSESVRISLQVPRNSDLDLHSGDGNITVDAVKGEVRLDSGDGDLIGRSLDGVLNAETSDGNIRVNGRFDRLDLHTGDGRIDAEVAPGSKMSSSWALRTSDGTVTLRLPQDFSTDLDAHTGDGRVSSDFPITVSGSLKENSLRGRLNGGGALLELRSGDGNIRLEKF